MGKLLILSIPDHEEHIFYHLIQQTGKPCANQRTKQKGPSADDTVFSKEQIPYCLCFHANQFVGCKLLFSVVPA